MKLLDIKKEDEGKRLDQFLFQNNPDYSRSYFGGLIKNGNVIVNSEIAKPSYRIKAGDKIEYEMTERQQLGKVAGEDIPLDIVFENDDVVVINKPAGIVVHPAAGHSSGTLVNALVGSYPQLEDAVYDTDDEVSISRPGLVHRLDKDTSGVLIVAKNTKAMISLANQIRDKKAKKIYLALCAGWPKEVSGKLINYLGRNKKDRKTYTEVGQEQGREAVSNFQVLQNYLTLKKERVSLVEFQIETGRTHQIRVQSMLAGFPIIGDQSYHTKESQIISEHLKAKRQILHAKSLTITLPNENSPQTFTAPPPSDFQKILDNLAV